MGSLGNQPSPNLNYDSMTGGPLSASIQDSHVPKTTFKDLFRTRAAQTVTTLNARANQLIYTLAPKPETMEPRHMVALFLQTLFSAKIKLLYPTNPIVHIVPYGSFTLNLFLPDSDIDFACYSTDLSYPDLCQLTVYILDDYFNTQRVHDANPSVFDYVKSFAIDSLDDPLYRCFERFRVRNFTFIPEKNLIKGIINNISVDLSFSTPAPLINTLFLEKVSRRIGRSGLFKRSVILIHAWCRYEAHILGGDTYMLNSCALRIMVLFILIQSPHLVSPIQVMLNFLGFFSTYDMPNHVLSLSQPFLNEQFDETPNPQLESLLLNPKRKLFRFIPLDEYKLLLSLRNILDPTFVYTNGLGGCLASVCVNKPDIGSVFRPDPKTIGEKLHAKMCALATEGQGKQASRHFSRISLKQPADSNALPAAQTRVLFNDFLKSAAGFELLDDQLGSFSLRCFNVVDPLCFTNNVGRSVNEASFARMVDAFKVGYIQLSSLVGGALDGEESVALVLVEFDLMFKNTLGHFAVLPLSDSSFSFLNIDLEGVERQVLEIANQVLGIDAPAS